MNTYFLNERQRQELRAKHPYEFDNVLKQYKKDLAVNTGLQWSEEEWKKAFHWVGEKWFELSRQSSLSQAWQKTSEEFHRHYAPKVTPARSEFVNPISHTAFLEDSEVHDIEKKKLANKGTKMIMQVFIGLVLWKILIIVIFQKACVAQ